MFNHVGIVFRNLKASGDFYRQVLEQIGIRLLEDHTLPDGTGWLVFGTTNSKAFFVVAAGRPSFWTESSGPASSPAHIAFDAPSREAVDRFHSVGLRCGAANNGDPGIRHGGAYAAFLIDLDGNNVEATYRSQGEAQ
ncbi:MAG TPA: VOC family protein [Candidatus Acidoferrales bacterium]|jgi:catechol 2,3-dioxygenase-like lactoylglutathione lyase family enzyme|nr:VOC family protein [Candidatus Acidoferrales bacterium]